MAIPEQESPFLRLRNGPWGASPSRGVLGFWTVYVGSSAILT